MLYTVAKIGKQQAEKDYLDKVVPLFKVRTPVGEQLESQNRLLDPGQDRLVWRVP